MNTLPANGITSRCAGFAGIVLDGKTNAPGYRAKSRSLTSGASPSRESKPFIAGE
jgi:hypothetical protein